MERQKLYGLFRPSVATLPYLQLCEDYIGTESDIKTRATREASMGWMDLYELGYRVAPVTVSYNEPRPKEGEASGSFRYDWKKDVWINEGPV